MNILYYDCFAGMSGDMNLAAMIELGVDPDYLRSELSRLKLDHEFEIKVTKGVRKGIHGTRVDVVLKNQGHAHEHHHHAHIHDPVHEHTHDGHDHGQHHEHDHGHHHDHGHVHNHHGVHADDGNELPPRPARHQHHNHADHHGHEHHHSHGHAHSHEKMRNLRDIEAIINNSDLPDAVKKTSLAIFLAVAKAEGKVHGKDTYDVHFHEVGATDSIVDIVGAAICHHKLGVDAVWCSSIELGGGFVNCIHGRMPVPAPATSEILVGCPTKQGAVDKEGTTPTGAAILATLTDHFTDTPEMVVTRIGYGIGHRDNVVPNVIRVKLARVEQKVHEIEDAEISQARLLQCNIDDMTGEALAVALEALMEAGAMDVHFTPIVMKKGRPATSISLLCSLEDEDRFKQLIFRHTTTLGIKSYPLEKTALHKNFVTMETALGPVTMKNAVLNGEVIRSKPELEDCKKLAREHGLSLAEIYSQINKILPQP